MAESFEERPIWGIHMGKVHLDSPIKQNFIAVGWSSVGDLSALPPTRDAFKAAVTKVYPDIKPGAVPVVAGTLYKFAHEMKIGDLLVYPSKIDKMLNFGTITSDYEFLPMSPNDTPNHRSVSWTRKIPRAEFSQSALHEIGSAVTLFQIRNNAEEFLAAYEGKPLKSEDVDAQIGDAAAASAVEEVEDFVIKRLKNGLTPRQFEFFVAHLLECMGYHCRVTQASGDGGVDILAHKDELGFHDLIKVQCKQTLNTQGQPQIAQLYGHVKGGERALFVTLGGFSPAAIEFERANQNVRLVSGEELVKLIFNHFEEFEPRYRALLPMKRIYTVDPVDEN